MVRAQGKKPKAHRTAGQVGEQLELKHVLPSTFSFFGGIGSVSMKSLPTSIPTEYACVCVWYVGYTYVYIYIHIYII